MEGIIMLLKDFWPNGTRIAVCLTFDNMGAAWDLLRFGNSYGMASEGNYALRRGAPRIMDICDKYDIKVTFFVEGWNGENNPAILQEMIHRGHEVAAHGWMHEDWGKLAPEEERELIRKTSASLEKATGAKPLGWRGPSGVMTSNTLNYLQELDYEYDSSFLDDDIPYVMDLANSANAFVQLPFSWQLDDAMYYSYSRHTPMEPFHVLDIWKEEFDFAYEETGYYMLCCHSRFSGRTVRARVLEKLIQYMRGHDWVWFARCDEVVRWVQKKNKG